MHITYMKCYYKIVKISIGKKFWFWEDYIIELALLWIELINFETCILRYFKKYVIMKHKSKTFGKIYKI